MNETVKFAKLSFDEIHRANKSVNSSVYQELQTSLAAGKTAPLLAYCNEIFGQFCTPKEIMIITTLLKSLDDQPLNDWTATLFPIMDRLIARFDTGSLAFFEQQHFSWISAVEDQWAEIINELSTALSNTAVLPAFEEVQEDQKALTDDRLWKVILFKAFGVNLAQTSKTFPKTLQAINLITDHSTAMISVLEPGKHIRPHTGLYKGVLRYHLGLKVPPNTGIRVKDTTESWQEGKSLVFDDTFEHEAWNKSDQLRAVLFVDFLRPLPFPLDALNRFIVFDLMPRSEFVKTTVKNESKYQELINLMDG